MTPAADAWASVIGKETLVLSSQRGFASVCFVAENPCSSLRFIPHSPHLQKGEGIVLGPSRVRAQAGLSRQWILT